MHKLLFSASALAFALATPSAMAGTAAADVEALRTKPLVRTAQAKPQESRPGTSEQGGMRSGDPGTAIPPTTGQPSRPADMVPMPSTTPGTTTGPVDPAKPNEATGQRSGDPGAGNLPTTPGGTPGTGHTTDQPVTPPGPTQPGAAQPSEGTGERTGAPGSTMPQTNTRPRQ